MSWKITLTQTGCWISASTSTACSTRGLPWTLLAWWSILDNVLRSERLQLLLLLWDCLRCAEFGHCWLDLLARGERSILKLLNLLSYHLSTNTTQTISKRPWLLWLIEWWLISGCRVRGLDRSVWVPSWLVSCRSFWKSPLNSFALSWLTAAFDRKCRLIHSLAATFPFGKALTISHAFQLKHTSLYRYYVIF